MKKKNDKDVLTFQKNNFDFTLEIAKDLIKIQSFLEGKMERNVIQYIENRIKKYHISYNILTLGETGETPIGIVVSIGEGKHSLILHSHIDTVPPGDQDKWNQDPFQPYCSSGKLYGLGACDDKGSLSAMISAFESLIPISSKFNGKLILMAMGGEERGGIGTQVAMKKGYRAEAAILGEPTNLEPKFAHKGVLRVEISVKGVSAHASNPNEGENAILYMAELIRELEKLSLIVEKEYDSYTGHSSMAITTIQGGTALNMIPDTCSISIDRRMVPGQEEGPILEQIEGVLQNFKKLNPKVEIEMKRIRCTRPAKTEISEELSQLVLKVVNEEFQRKIEPEGFPACCDMTFLRNEGNMPVVIIGPGDIGMAHKKNEYIDIKSLGKAYHIYKKIALKWLLRD